MSKEYLGSGIEMWKEICQKSIMLIEIWKEIWMEIWKELDRNTYVEGVWKEVDRNMSKEYLGSGKIICSPPYQR